jgi:SOS-response transcriptional repressor LexA
MTEALDRLYESMAEEPPLKPTPFVGSGVSRAATAGNRCAGWGGLLLDGIEVCERVVPFLPPGWADQRKDNLKNADVHAYLALAEDIIPRLRQVGDGIEFATWIKRAIGGLRLKAEGHELIKAVRSLGNFFVTTNYDSLIEEMDPPLPSCTWTDDEYDTAIRATKLMVHLHGVAGKPESIILSGSDYERLRNAERAQTLNKAIFLANRFLFIGCGDGLYDPNIGPLMTFLDKIKTEANKEHYLLVRGSQLRQFNERWRSRLIVPVAYGAEFAELRPFLEKLANGERIEVSQDPKFYEQRAATKAASLLDLRRTAQEKIQAALDALDHAAPAVRDIELHSVMAPEISTWEPDAQEPIHEQKAASLTDAAARLESCLELAVPAFEAAEIGVWPFTAPKFARLGAWVAPVAERVSNLEDASRQLLDKVTRARDHLHVYADIYTGYQAPDMALKRAQANIERAAEIASSLSAGLGRLQEDQPSGRSEASRPVAGQAHLFAVPREPGEAADPHTPATADPPPDGAESAYLNAPSTQETPPPRPGGAKHSSRTASDISFSGHDEIPEPESRVVPLFEAVGAGNPLEADENPRDYLALPAQLVRGEEVFLVLVRGESMMEDGVLEGDYLIVDRGARRENGDMVVAFIVADSGAAVKRIWQEGSSLRLESSNPDYTPRDFTRDEDIIVHGKVTGVVRPHVPRAGRRSRSSG